MSWPPLTGLAFLGQRHLWSPEGNALPFLPLMFGLRFIISTNEVSLHTPASQASHSSIRVY